VLAVRGQSVRLHWHRSDLRAPDNVGLSAAADAGAVLPVFVFDDDILQYGSPPRVAFMLDALAELRSWYRSRDGDLLVARGDPASVFPALVDEYDADGVTWNVDYSGLARERDERVRDALDVTVETYHDDVHHEPGSITTNEGDPYSVYTYFRRKWRDRPKEPPVDAPADGALVEATGESLPRLDDLGFDEPEADVERGSRDLALEGLEVFCEGPIYRYEERRDYPAADATSRLSAHLRWGTVGVRELYAATERAAARADDADDRESVDAFRGELAWREFYRHVLDANPGVVTENYVEYENPIQWRDDAEALQAWKDGRTGYPIVDAGMRQLRAEAWMHNRVRMIVASFLTKDLLLDWRLGYEWFREKLADHDTANDTGGWQWAASTGTDAQPYFRIFNPMTQGERYDPDAEYVREYVTELRDVDPETIHSWHERSDAERDRVAPDYPAPIVDHAEARERALATFGRARGEEPDAE
jgi:deoxyribodipyrimidine photo-lyase